MIYYAHGWSKIYVHGYINQQDCFSGDVFDEDFSHVRAARGRAGKRRNRMHHKRKRPKNRRAGCLMCKPHKANGSCPRHLDMQAGNRRRYEALTHQLRCEGIKKP